MGQKVLNAGAPWDFEDETRMIEKHSQKYSQWR